MFYIQEDIIKMMPSRVDPNKKQAKSSINQVEEDPFYLDRMARTVNSFPSQATLIMLRGHLECYIMNVLMIEKHSKFQLQICYIR
jgi:hypothetical protein